jgi:hypothetical protein
MPLERDKNELACRGCSQGTPLQSARFLDAWAWFGLKPIQVARTVTSYACLMIHHLQRGVFESNKLTVSLVLQGRQPIA